MDIYDLKGPQESINPVYFIRDGFENIIEDTSASMSAYAQLAKILPDENAAEIKVRQTAAEDEYIVMKALVFPYINVLWLGIVVMVIGFFIAAWNRITKKEKKELV